MSLLERCPHFRGCYVNRVVTSRCVTIREVSSFQRVLMYVHVQGPEDVSLLERYMYMYVVSLQGTADDCSKSYHESVF